MGKNSPIPTARTVATTNQRTRASTRDNKSSSCTCCCFIEQLFTLACIIAIAVALYLYLPQIKDALSQDDDSDVGGSFLFPVAVSEANVTRQGNDYIGVIFLTEMGAAETAAFENAAHTWSEIIADTLDEWTQSQQFDAGDNLCQEENITASEDMNYDFLIILASVRAIDGENGILGQAGPCNFLFVSDGSGRNFPSLGIMDFDSADINDMISEGTLDSVILHEMAHVLGFGGMWSRSTQGKIVGTNSAPLIEDPVIVNGQLNLGNIPKFVGDNAITAYNDIMSLSASFVPIEDGFTNGNRNSAGQGSLDSHWDIDALPGELMNFAISASGSHPLSEVTLASLEDEGYLVDLSLADSFNRRIAARNKKALRGSGKVFDLSHDRKEIVPEFN